MISDDINKIGELINENDVLNKQLMNCLEGLKNENKD